MLTIKSPVIKSRRLRAAGVLEYAVRMEHRGALLLRPAITHFTVSFDNTCSADNPGWVSLCSL